LLMSTRKWFHVDEEYALKEFGYSPKEPEDVRHDALRKAVEANGSGEVIKRLNAIANVTENSQPTNSRIYREDENWVRQNLE